MIVADCLNAPKLDPRVRRTRRLIEEAYRSLLAEREYDEITVGDIAERATVNRATFYAHFEDKQDLTVTLLKGDLHDALLASLSERAPLSAETLAPFATALFEAMAKIFGACPKKANAMSPLIGTVLQETVQEMLQTWIGHDPHATRAFSGASPETVATVLAWSLYGAAYRWSHGARRVPAARAAGEVVQLLFR